MVTYIYVTNLERELSCDKLEKGTIIMKRVHSIMLILSSLSVIAITILYLHFTDTLQYVIAFFRSAINVYGKDIKSIYNFSGNNFRISFSRFEISFPISLTGCGKL